MNLWLVFLNPAILRFEYICLLQLGNNDKLLDWLAKTADGSTTVVHFVPK